MSDVNPSDHAEQRLYERFNLVLDDALLEQLAYQIDTGASAFLGHQDNTRELHAIEIAGRTVVLVWQPRDRTLVTFLHPDEFRERLLNLSASTPLTRDRKASTHHRQAKQAKQARKLAREQAHAMRLAQHAEWMERMAAQQLRTRKHWYDLGQGIRPGSIPKLHLHPVHPSTVKFYHVRDTVPQKTCRHEWVEGTTNLYCLQCQLDLQKP